MVRSEEMNYPERNVALRPELADPRRRGAAVRRAPGVAAAAGPGQVRVRAGAAGGSGVRAGPRDERDLGLRVDERGDAEQ